jgi:hypothetical protein
MALFGTVKWGKIPIVSGALYPLLLCGEFVKE